MVRSPQLAARAAQDESARGASASAQSPVLVLSSRGEAILEVSMNLRRGRPAPEAPCNRPRADKPQQQCTAFEQGNLSWAAADKLLREFTLLRAVCGLAVKPSSLGVFPAPEV